MTTPINMHATLPFFNITNSELSLLYQIKHNTKPNLLQSNLIQKNENYLTTSQVNKIIDLKLKFSILSINSRSLNKNFIKLETLINQLNFDPTVIFVSETWINPKRPLLYSLNKYSFYNNPGANNAGGAGLFIRNNINFKIINNYNLNLQNCEETWAEITFSGRKPITICSLYRHPEHKFTDFQNSLLKTTELLIRQNKQFIIGGDVNINFLNEGKSVTTFKNELTSQGIIQLTQSATRFSNDNMSLLDHIYTNIEQTKFNTKCITFNISDHVPVLTILTQHTIDQTKINRRLIRDMNKFQSENFLNDLQQNITNLDINELTSGNDLWNNFESILYSTLDQHAPIRMQSRKEFKKASSPWITYEIIKSIKIKQKLYKKAITKSNPSHWTKFKEYRNKLTRTMEKAKRNYYRKEINKTKANPRKLWKTLNNIINLKKNTNLTPNIKIYDDTDCLVNDPKIVSNIFNHYFANVGLELSNKIDSNLSNDENTPTNNNLIQHSFFLNPITPREMESYINKLHPNKATPKLSIPIKIIKISSTILSPIITKIFNICISQGIFPDKLKLSQITPIYKSGDKCRINNHRPITILSPFSKLFEYHLNSQLTKFLNNNNILNQFQYGFRSNSSTDMAITQISEETIQKLQNKQITCLIFLDLAKAFDCVDHQILLTKLHNYGIRGLPLKLFKSYLSNRVQQTIITNCKSDPEFITCGVPQGSILAPQFFNIYINNIADVSKFKIKLFADDACLSYSSFDYNNLETEINNELKKINQWRKINKLSVNFSKSNYMIFTQKKININMNITMDGNRLEKVNKTKYLGVIMDSKFSWKEHITYITNKISKSSYILSKIRHYVSLPILKMLYYSLVHPHLNYCITAWGGTTATTLKPLVTLQKKIIKLITFNPFDSPSAPIFNQLNILNIDTLYKLNLAILMHKIHHNTITGNYNIALSKNTHSYNTRGSINKNYYQTHNRLNIGLNSFITNGIKLWNSISLDKKILPLHNFKKQIKQHLINSFKEQIT